MIMMAGIDYNLAALSLRERFSFTDESLEQAYRSISSMPEAPGAVIISTCNRTELYLTSEKKLDAFGLLCSLAGLKEGDYPHYRLEGNDVLRHLCRLASGADSQIWGEDQILAQVKSAIAVSRENRAAGNILEVVFREAVAAAKRIKTEIKLGTRESSIVYRALEVIREHKGIERVLVIGNGEIGRLMTRALVESGYHAAMTLRTYRHGETLVPAGAHTVSYAERYSSLSECAALISATRSPHYTVELDKARALDALPGLWLDLAVPRDIDPQIGTLPGVSYYDVDSLSAGDGAWENREEKLRQAGEIIEKHVADFEKWLDYQKGQSEGFDKKEYFPLFISSRGKKVLLAGGGKIATRRVLALLRFEFDVTVVAPEVSRELERLGEEGRIELLRRKFADSDLDGCFIVIAATGDREVNRYIGELASERGILASVADSRSECGFLFPAIAVSGDVVAGLTSGGRSHHAVVQAAKKVREVL